MYAVVKTGGKQYRVAKDDVIRVEKLDAEAGSKVHLDQVLAVGDDKEHKVGAPFVDGAVVEAEVVDQTRAKKITVFKKKRRQNYRRKKGHRQHQTVLKVVDISVDGSKKAAKAESKKADAKKTEAKKAEAKTAETKTAETKKAESKKAGAKKAEAKKASAKKTAKKSTAKKAAAKKDAGSSDS